MWRIGLLLVLFPFAALSQTIRVTSGEHATFSRLVLTLPSALPWQLGRTENGYELSLAGEDVPIDVSGVFDLIPKDRLKGIFVDPVNGNLQLTVGCECHALPFSLNETTIVIDVRDGRAPDASSFEQGLDGQVRAALEGQSVPAPRPQFRQPEPAIARFDWTKVSTPPPTPVPFPVPQTADNAGNIREVLVAQMAEGASRAVINLAMPEKGTAAPAAPFLAEDVPIRVTGSVGLHVGSRDAEPDIMQDDGEYCVPDESLDINAWAAEDVDATQYSGLHNGLVGEFDHPQEDAILAAAKRQIYLGFGAEARSMLMAFGDMGAESATLHDLAALVDGEIRARGSVFSGMASCDTAAAMWAFLAADTGNSAALNDMAMKRAFSALPAHLRLHIGPRLIERLVAADQKETAFAIRESMGRGVMEDMRVISLATADVMMADGNAQNAIPQLEAVTSDGGAMQAQALAKLVMAQIAAGQPVETADADAIHAMIAEYEGHPLQTDLIDAYGLALSGSQQFAAAVAFAEAGHRLNPAFWSLLADRGTDDEVLVHAILPPDTDIPPEAALRLADRLEGLGFLTEATAWRKILPAAQQNELPGTTIDALPPDTDTVQEVPLPTGDPSGQGDSSRAIDPVARAARWNRNWALVAQQEDSAWSNLARDVTSRETASEEISLASATASLSQSAAARTLIEDLIRETADIPLSP